MTADRLVALATSGGAPVVRSRASGAQQTTTATASALARRAYKSSGLLARSAARTVRRVASGRLVVRLVRPARLGPSVRPFGTLLALILAYEWLPVSRTANETSATRRRQWAQVEVAPTDGSKRAVRRRTRERPAGRAVSASELLQMRDKTTTVSPARSTLVRICRIARSHQAARSHIALRANLSPFVFARRRAGASQMCTTDALQATVCDVVLEQSSPIHL